MTRRLPRLVLAILLLAGAGCDRVDPNAQVEVSTIGDIDPLLTLSTAQGLVRYDALGQIEPGLSIRWAISEDGLFYTFRLDDIDGLDARSVAQQLRRAIRPIRFAGTVREIVAVTPEVVEIRLDAPQPDLLDLLAQPEMAILASGRGTGPLQAGGDAKEGYLLVPADTKDDSGAEAENDTRRQPPILLRKERASVAILAFLEGRRTLLLGGRFQDLPLARVANVRDKDMRIDPAVGLFGLKIEPRSSLLRDPRIRRALSMSVDRGALLSAFRITDWTPAAALLPAKTVEIPRPSQPDWIPLSQEARSAEALAQVAKWRTAHPAQSTSLRIALPDGPGATLLFRQLATMWQPLGISLERVPSQEAADLRLIDEVAPSPSASWYLRHFECRQSKVCDPVADAAIARARATTNPQERAEQIAEAQARLEALTPFIPLGQPLRWSLVSPRVTGFQTNNRAVHPLNHLLSAND